MLLPAPLLLVALCVPLWTQACGPSDEDPPTNVVLGWVKQRLLESLGLEEPPSARPHHQPRHRLGLTQHTASTRLGRAALTERRKSQPDTSQVILFPSTDSTCVSSSDLPPTEGAGHFTYYFQPSGYTLERSVTLAHFWFYSGGNGTELQEGNTSAPVFILTSHQQLEEAAKHPEKRSPDGWSVYHIKRPIHSLLSDGPFVLQVRCPNCGCHSEPEKTPFLQFHMLPKSPERSRRSSVPWSPTAIDLLQRPSQEQPVYNDCHRMALNISLEELGWDNWIVHPRAFTFHYCHGNCSSREHMTTYLGIKQCCAPVPGTMKSLKFRTTSDGGYSFKYDTLPNMIAEECSCI
ncbi:INHA protein, partial [Polyodon spathula]|nr:inhibin alpha chain-like [Polyodon spathula]MBN3273717.1 INHA protein [Polyodon spathula]